MNKIYNKLKTLNFNYFRYGRISFAQEGEDLLLSRFLEPKKTGFYVDIGSHHPYRFSNTQWFYAREWNGINIEPNPDLIKNFKKHRKRDINLNIGISDSNTELEYYMMDEPALNTFSTTTYENLINTTNYRLKSSIKIQTRPLREVLGEYLGASQKVDFMSVDTEGYDLNVIKSNDWEKYRPDYVLVEIHELNLEALAESPIISFMRGAGYGLISKLAYTAVFRNLRE